MLVQTGPLKERLNAARSQLRARLEAEKEEVQKRQAEMEVLRNSVSAQRGRLQSELEQHSSSIERAKKDQLTSLELLRRMESRMEELNLVSAKENQNVRRNGMEELETTRLVLEAKIDRLTKQKQSKVAKRMATVQELRKHVRMFEYLGLKFLPGTPCSTGTCLRLEFELIDPRDPECIFWFEIKVDDENKYSLTDMKPKLKNVERLVNELNETNDFSRFVCNMRKQFKLSVQ